MVAHEHTAGIKQFISSVCGLRDKQACRQTLAACLLTDLCEDTTHKIFYILAISPKTARVWWMEVFSHSPLWCMLEKCLSAVGKPFFLAQNSSHYNLIHIHVGIVQNEKGFNSSGLTRHTRVCPACCWIIDICICIYISITKDNCVFATSTRQFQTAMSDRKKMLTCFTLEWVVLRLIHRCFYFEQIRASYRFHTLWSGFEWCTGKTGLRQCMRR